MNNQRYADVSSQTRKGLLKETSVERLISIAERLPVARTRDFVNAGIHPQALKRTLRRGLLVKMVRGLYVSKGRSLNFEHQVMLACKRVPRGVECLKSAPMFHGLLPTDPGSLWMAINFNARKSVVNGQLLRFVRFGGDALTQGVISTRIDGVPVRVHSLAKTIADCLTESGFIPTSHYRRSKNASFSENAVWKGYGISRESAA